MGQREAQIATYIKGGGNWQDIPLTYSDTRLDNIRATGGRTTYYGRLAWDKPSYTIATYFNRVGNGCNLHPEQNRVMSNREAARFQSFPDDFIFQGSKTSQYKQIGNAVPPLLARLVSSLIKPHLDSYNFVDLFAGCGGMSEGFIMNGFNLLAVNEVDKNIMLTNKFNHSKHTDESHFILGDVTQEEIKQKIINACEGNSVDVVIGGPPCQGFSYAGWRDPNDKRNQLFRDFVELVKRLNPKFFVMENVLGILTMRRGEAIREIIEAFEEIGYHVNPPLKLNAANFGVPQKRKRVIIIGSLDHNITITQPMPLFEDDSNIYPPLVTVRDAIENLPRIDDGGGEVEIDFVFKSKSPYDMLMQKEIDFDKFYELMCKK
jgi:DNA (cytosine-5)-methyltransferase 1